MNRLQVGVLYLVFLLLVPIGYVYGEFFTPVTEEAIGEAHDAVPGRENVYWPDVNGDGWPDLHIGTSVIFLNNQDGTFTRMDTTGMEEALGGRPVFRVAWGDADNDGVLDCFLSNWDRTSDTYVSHVYHAKGLGEEGDWRFDMTEIYNMPMNVRGGQPCLLDGDMDGILECYVGMFGNWAPDYGVGKDKYFGDFYGLYIDRTPDFIPQLEEGDYRRPVRGVTAGDYDNDGDTDVFVPVYGISYAESWENYLWQNDGMGNFTDVATSAGVAIEPNGRYGVGLASGASWGDFDNDGDLDLVVANIHGRLGLYENLGDGTFENITDGTGLSTSRREWHNPLWLDWDNDGDLDLMGNQWYDFIAYAYENLGPENPGHFSSRASTIGLNPAYQFTRILGWGAADYDRDGDLDLAWWGGAGTWDGFHLYRNDLDEESEDHHWMVFELVGDGDNVNRTAPGSQIRIGYSETEWSGVRQVESVSADQSMNMQAVHFGLGEHEQFQQVEVRWVGGDVEYWSWEDLGGSTNQWVTLEYGTGSELGVRETEPERPARATLSDVWPNPFNGETRVRVTLPSPGHVKLALYDLLGREVMRVHDGSLSAGTREFILQAESLASGLYFLRMSGDVMSVTKKVMLVR